MPRRSDYPAILAKAEKAVESVKDPDLKRLAFQKILDNLLADMTSEKRDGSRTIPAAARTRDRKSNAKRGPRAYIEELVADGFFKKPKALNAVREELENRGHHIPTTSLSGPLQLLCQGKALRRQKKTDGEKKGFFYSNW